jgi:hypothetical protein
MYMQVAAAAAAPLAAYESREGEAFRDGYMTIDQKSPGCEIL